jgi:hypothetical protein
LDLKLGFVDLALCNLGDSNQNSKAQGQLIDDPESTDTFTYITGTTMTVMTQRTMR